MSYRSTRRTNYWLGLVAGMVVAGWLLWNLFRSTTKPPLISDWESHQAMRLVLAEVAKDAAVNDLYVGTGQVADAQARLQAIPGSPSVQRWGALYQLARAQLNLGHEAEALENYREAYQLLPILGSQLPENVRAVFLIDFGVAYLRQAETQNCCQSPTGNSCIFPIQADGQHRQTEYSRAAMKVFEELLATVAVDSEPGAAARWLLNLSAMTVGDYPDQVDSKWRIDPQMFASDKTWPAFANIAPLVGVARFSMAGGAVIEDFDCDGDLDLFTTTWDPGGAPSFYLHEAGKFVDRTEQAGLAGITGGLNLTHTDYNNDGYCDLFVLRGGWLGQRGCIPNSLLRNNGDGSFTDVTFQAGLATPSWPSQTATWADFDLDGDLDVYVGNEANAQLPAACQLFRNNGDGTFSDIAQPAGVSNGRLAKAVTSGDFDGDRYPDIYVSNYQSANRLYRNQRDGTFLDVAEQLGVAEPKDSFTCWFWDFNNDGRLDLFVSAYAGGIAEIASAYVNRPFDQQATLARLYQATETGTFVDVAGQLGLTRPHHPMGANFADIDNDGYLDFYLGTGWPEYREIMPNAMYRNVAGQAFTDVTFSSRTGHLQKGHAVAFGDLDADGDLDLFEQLGGFVPGDRFYDVLFQNPGFPNRWIDLQLLGVRTNRVAVGARLKLTIGEGHQARSIYRFVGSGGSFGENPFRQLIGVGQADTIQELEVLWPVTGVVQLFRDVPTNQAFQIIEGDSRLKRRP